MYPYFETKQLNKYNIPNQPPQPKCKAHQRKDVNNRRNDTQKNESISQHQDSKRQRKKKSEKKQL